MTLLPEDRVLLTEFREGRRDALERVYRHYVKDVARYLKHGFTYMSGGRPTSFTGFSAPFDLETAVQEVFFRAFAARTRAAYDGLRPYGAFLVGIARNVALKEIERRAIDGARIELLDETTEQNLAAVPASPEDSAEATIDERRARELVLAFLDGDCDDRDRRLFRLRFDDNLSQEGAAQAAGLTRIQVRRWETSFRARVLRYLKRADFVRGDDA